MLENKILVIDDEQDYQQQFYRVLSSEGYECHCVGSGEEALEKIKKISFKVVILDLFLLPNKMTGIETLRKIRPLDLDICIIITTAYASVEAMFTAVNDGGAQTYIKKAGKWAEDLKITVNQGMNWINPIRFKKEERKVARHKKSIIKRCFLTGAPFCP